MPARTPSEWPVPPSPNSARSPTKLNGGSRPPRRRRTRAAERVQQRPALTRGLGGARDLPPHGRERLPAPRKQRAHPAVRPPGQAGDPGHGQPRRLQRAPRATHQRQMRQCRRPQRVPGATRRLPTPERRRPQRLPRATHQSRIRQCHRGELKPHTSGYPGLAARATRADSRRMHGAA
jgi:hypothetical protein